VPLKHALTNAAYRSVTVDKMVKALRRISNVNALRFSGESNYVTFHNYYVKFRRRFGAPTMLRPGADVPLTPPSCAIEMGVKSESSKPWQSV